MRHHMLWPVAMFAVAAIFYLYEFLLRVAPGAMYADLMQEFGANATEMGYLSSIYFVSYAVLQLPVGALIDRFGARLLLTLAIIMCAGSTIIFAMTSSYSMALVARLFIGAGSAFAFICCIKILSTWFQKEFFAPLAGFTLACGAVGAIFGQGPVAYMLNFYTWREIFWGLGIAGMFLAALAWVLVRDGDDATGTEDEIGFMHCLTEVLRRPQNWLVALYAFLMTAPIDALGGLWGIPYLEQAHGMSRELASSAVSMTFAGMACASPLIGFISDRWYSRKKPMLLFGLVAIGSLLVLVYGPQLDFWTASALFFAHGFFGTYIMSFVVAREINEVVYIGTTVGFVNAFSNFGSSILQSGIGKGLDTAHIFNASVSVQEYTRENYFIGLAPVPVFLILAILVVLPFIRESYTKG